MALPVELSESEQKELLTKYVQENFVDQGSELNERLMNIRDDLFT